MTFREFMQKYKAKKARIDFIEDEEPFGTMARLAEKHLKKAYNAGYWEDFREGVEKGWNECENTHKIVDKVKVIEVKNENTF